MNAASLSLSLIAAALLIALGLACLLLPPRGDIPMTDPAPVHVRFPRRRR